MTAHNERLAIPGKRLGKHPKKENAQTFKLVKYISLPNLPKIPTSFAYSRHVSGWPMYLNNDLGDCVLAEQGHHVQAITASAGHQVNVTDDDVLHAYEAVGGYRPGDPSTDNGAVILDAMSYWRKTGIGGHRIAAFADVAVHDHLLVKAGIYLFGGLSIGLNLPIAAQSMGRNWIKPRTMTGSGEPGSWGGHCVYLVDYTSRGLVIVTWGELVHMSYGFFDAYCDEAWAAISKEFIDANTGKSERGLDMAQLQADLSEVTKVN